MAVRKSTCVTSPVRARGARRRRMGYEGSMIVMDRPSWLRLLFIIRGSALDRVWKRVVFVTAVALAITAAHHYRPGSFVADLTTTPFTARSTAEVILPDGVMSMV